MRSNSCDCPFSVFRKYAKIGIVNDSKRAETPMNHFFSKIN